MGINMLCISLNKAEDTTTMQGAGKAGHGWAGPLCEAPAGTD